MYKGSMLFCVLRPYGKKYIAAFFGFDFYLPHYAQTFLSGTPPRPFQPNLALGEFVITTASDHGCGAISVYMCENGGGNCK